MAGGGLPAAATGRFTGRGRWTKKRAAACAAQDRLSVGAEKVQGVMEEIEAGYISLPFSIYELANVVSGDFRATRFFPFGSFYGKAQPGDYGFPLRLHLLLG